jgi:acetyl esterase/lipase
MMYQVWMVRHYVRKGDLKRNAQIPEPEGVTSFRDIRYAKGFGKWHKLDVYRPSGVKGPLPLLVVVHGGGWMYGDKEIYHLYAKDLARRGFAVICYNYVLAPRKKFPYQLSELDWALLWARNHADEYGFDTTKVFLVGDSAGAQMSVQYCVAETNPDYAKLFSLQFPLQICGLGLNCGTYVPLGTPYKEKNENFIWPLYLGKHYDLKDPRYDILTPMNSHFPPCYVLTGEADFIKNQNSYLVDVLKKNKIPYVFKEYTTKEGNKLQHVFHVTINEEHAILANDEECAFFTKIIQGNC